MSRRILACAVLLSLCLLTFAGWHLSNLPAAAPPDKEVFGLTKVWSFHLAIPEKEYQAIQPTGGFGFGPPMPPKDDKKDKRDRDKNLWGVEFPWVQGELTAGAQTFQKIGLRYDGNGGYFA